MNTNIRIDVYLIYQNDNDVIVLNIGDRNNVLDNFYIKANTLALTSVKVWGEEMPEVVVDGESYYHVDAKNLKDGNEFFLELITGKNEVYKNTYYEEILKSDAVIHSFDCYFNDHKEEYRFGKRCHHNNEDDYQDEVQFLNGIEDVLTSTAFSSLYLPSDYQLSKQIMYYPKDSALILSDSNQDYSIRVETGPSLNIELATNFNNDEQWTNYSYNDIDFIYLKRDVDKRVYYEVRFLIPIDDETSNTYYYQINKTNLDDVKALLRAIDGITLDSLSQ